MTEDFLSKIKQRIKTSPEAAEPTFKEVMAYYRSKHGRWIKPVSIAYVLGGILYAQYKSTYLPDVDDHESYFRYVFDVIFWIAQVV